MDRPYFWEIVQNSLIVVLVAVGASIVLAFIAAVALAKYRFTGRKLFIVADDRDPDAAAVGLVIPLYVVLAQYHLTNTLTGVILTYITFVLPFAVWTLRGLHPRYPEGAGGGRDGRRLEPARGIRADPAAARRARARGNVRVRVHQAWNEYIFASVILTDQTNHTVTVWLSYFLGTSRNTDWGALMAASTLTAIPVVVFFLLVQRRIAFGLTSGAVRG